MSELAIGTENLMKTYAKIDAVAGVSLSVKQGSIYGFLGRNGAGKTTTIKMLLGLARPDNGSARVLGMDALTERIPILRRTAFVSEKKTLYPVTDGLRTRAIQSRFLPHLVRQRRGEICPPI